MDELMLERLLRRAAANSAYPPTPALRGRVLAAITEPAPARPSRRPAFALAAIATIATIALALSIALTVPNSRSAIAEFFGVEGSKIERLPTPAPGVTPTPLPAPADPAALATPIARRSGAPCRLPAGHAAPSGRREWRLRGHGVMQTLTCGRCDRATCSSERGYRPG